MGDLPRDRIWLQSETQKEKSAGKWRQLISMDMIHSCRRLFKIKNPFDPKWRFRKKTWEVRKMRNVFNGWRATGLLSQTLFSGLFIVLNQFSPLDIWTKIYQMKIYERGSVSSNPQKKENQNRRGVMLEKCQKSVLTSWKTHKDGGDEIEFRISRYIQIFQEIFSGPKYIYASVSRE